MNAEFLEKNSFDLRGFLLLLWVRKWSVLVVVLIGLSLTSIGMASVSSLYMGRTLVLIEVPKGEQGDSILYNEIEIFRSRVMARRVADRLNLMSDPEFNGRFDYKEGVVGKGFKKLSVYGSELETLPENAAEKGIDAVVSHFLKMLDVRLIDGSNVIEVEFMSVSANRAALITNSIADLYLEKRFDKEFQVAQKQSSELKSRLSELQEQVENSEQAVIDYSLQHPLVGELEASSDEAYLEMNSQLAAARTKYTAVEARLARVRKHGDDSSSVIQGLKGEKMKLEGGLAILSARYGDKHPDIINAKSEIEELRSSIVLEKRKVLATLKSDVKSSAARVRSLEEALAELKGKSSDDKEIVAQLNILKREAQSAQLVFDAFLEAYQQRDVSADEKKLEARVLSYAVSATQPSYPNKLLWWGIGIVLSLLVAVGVVALLEKLDNTFRRASQLEAMFDYPCYGLIPQMAIGSQRELADYIVSKPSSALAESVRTLRTVLNLRTKKGNKKTKVVTVTSSLSGEGKTVLSVWLGRLAAKSSEKVIVIDADLRRPDVHHCVGQSNDATLVDYLTDQKELADIIQKTDPSGVHMIYGRSVPNSALDLVSIEKMAKLVEKLRKAYDLVIIDSPACLAVSDAQVLANMSDHTVYAVEWGKTSRDVVASGVKKFIEMENANVSFVLTCVDMERYAKYGADHYSQYKECYNN